MKRKLVFRTAYLYRLHYSTNVFNNKRINMFNKTTKLFITGIILLLTAVQLNAQGDSCIKFNREKALLEIKNKSPKIVIVGGIIRAARPGDDKFAKKFKIQFIDTGCVMENTDCIAAYNKATFEYLDKKYGKKWRKYSRKDLIGL